MTKHIHAKIGTMPLERVEVIHSSGDRVTVKTSRGETIHCLIDRVDQGHKPRIYFLSRH